MISVSLQKHKEQKMDASVYSEAVAFVARANANSHTGFCEDAADWQNLNADLGGIIPEWYSSLMASVPLAGLSLGWQSSELDGLEGVSWMDWFDTSNIRLEALELHPGKSLLSRGYFCVAGANGTGDQYFICVHEGRDPPLYQIDHETDEDADQILAAGRNTIASSLSMLFGTAQVEAEPFYD